MSARKYSDVVKGRPGEASSRMRTFQQENEDEALKIVLDMSKVRSFKQLHCFLYLGFSKCYASTVGLFKVPATATHVIAKVLCLY